jgi:hypothetical protein
MAALTKAEMAQRAAEDGLGIARLGQAIQNQDKVRLEQAYDEVYADLQSEGIAAWASTASVPNEYVPHMANLMAHNCMGTYKLSNDRAQRLLMKTGSDGNLAKREIRKLLRPSHEFTDEVTDY